MRCNKIKAISIAITGTGNTAVSTITVPADVIFAPGVVYNIALDTQIPTDMKGTIVNISNGTIAGNVLLSNGNYARAGTLCCRRVLKVRYLNDPSHFKLLGVTNGC